MRGKAKNANECEHQLEYWQERLRKARKKEGIENPPPSENYSDSAEKINAEIPASIPQKLEKISRKTKETDKCPYCMNDIPTGTNTCPHCGNPIAWFELSASEKWVVCPNCGYALKSADYSGQPCPRCENGGE